MELKALLASSPAFPKSLRSPDATTFPRATPSESAQRLVRTDGRDPEVVRFQTSVISYFVDAAELLGIPKSLAAIYGACFASPQPLSYTEISGHLYLSAGSISQGVRILCGVGALKDVSQPGDRVARLEPDIELRKLILHYLEQRVEKQLDAGKQRIRDIKGSVPRQDPAAAKILAARVKSLDGWHTKSRALLPLIKAALKLT